MINSKKCIKSTKLSIIQLKIANLFDLILHKNPFYKKSMLIEHVENSRNKFFIKKVTYIKIK